MYVRELMVSYRRRLVPVPSDTRTLSRPADAASMLASLLRDEAVEVFAVLFLNVKQRLLGYHQLSRGSIDSTIANPREVFQAALLAHAASVIVGHNHPSGDPEPSPDDRALTQRLVQAGALIGVDVLDHIIVTADERYYSFKEGGEIPCR
jgi:DNA repair protein RadC